MNELTEWLLTGPPWVQYRTRVDLLSDPEDGPEVLAARQAMLAHPQIQRLLSELAEWPGPILKSHKTAGHPLHKLTFVADLGLLIGDPGMPQIVERIFQHRAERGPFQVLANINPRYGGTGEDQWVWMLCDAPLIVYALVKFGLGEDAQVHAAIQHLVGLVRDNGWPCAVTPELGRFRGPGRAADPCPFANLVMLKALSQMPTWHDETVTRTGAETLLALWERRRERRPYLFGMGTDFAKLKAPLVWYDILHVTEVLTHFSWLREDKRLREMVSIVHARADENGRFTAESVWRDWNGWDFGQKRTASPWLTLIAQRMLTRFGASTQIISVP